MAMATMLGASGAFKVLFVYTVIIFISYQSWHSLPEPLGPSAQPGLFSEHRAMAIVRKLADDIGGRQVGTNGVREAGRYLLSELEDIRAVAEAERPDLDVEIDVQTTSGAYHLELFLTPFYLTYDNLENVILRIRPRNATTNAALLVNAHFDSAIASPGAADCAACTAIAVEVARAIVSSDSARLETSAIFLLNGGEETYMNAAHGFLTQHPWAEDVTQFVNIESTGSYGPDVVFRSNSDLLLNAYLKAAKSPRANVVFQDIFDLGIMPAETDYAVFAHESAGGAKSRPSVGADTARYGDLPGIDIATMFDSRSYHTALDESKRMPDGCAQNFGDNVMAIVLKASQMMGASDDGGKEEAGAGGSLVYFDVLGVFVIAYPFWVARIVHCVPLALTTALVAAMKIGGVEVPVLEGATTFLLSCVGSMLSPVAFFGLTGLLVQPMAWYGRPYIAAMILVPTSIAGSFMPYVFTWTRQKALQAVASADAPALQNLLVGHSLGSSLVLSLLSAYMTISGGMKHTAYMFVIWVLSTHSALIMKQVYFRKKPSRTRRRRIKDGFDTFDVVDTLVMHLPALVVCVHMSLFGFLFFLDRISTMGSSMDWHGPAHADMIIGLITGFLFFVSFGPLVPFLAYHFAEGVAKAMYKARLEAAAAAGETKPTKVSKGKSVKSKAAAAQEEPVAVPGRASCVLRCAGGLLLLCVASVAAASALIRTQEHRNSFSAHNPKRVFVQRLHVLKGGRPPSGGSTYDGAIESTSLTMLGVDSVPLGNVLEDMEGASALRRSEPGPDHLLAAYPITRFMKDSASVAMEAGEGERRQVLANLPSLEVEASKTGGVKRCAVKMSSPFAGYYLVNVTGPASKFSFSENDGDALIPSELSQSGEPTYAVRHVSNELSGGDGLDWVWWVETEQPEAELRVSWAVSNITSTPYLDEVVGRLPDYVNPIPITTYLGRFEC